MSGLLAVFTRGGQSGECATHGSTLDDHDGCMKCGAGTVATQTGKASSRVAVSADAEAGWLERQARVLEMASRLDPAAASAARLAAEARVMAAMTRGEAASAAADADRAWDAEAEARTAADHSVDDCWGS